MKNKFFFRKILAVTVAGVAVVAVYFYTSSTIQEKVAPTSVVVAVQDIPPHTEITKEMVQLAPEIPRQALPQENPYADSLDDVVGKWTVDGYGVSAKGFVNTKKVVEEEELPDAGLLKLEPGEYAFTTLVDLDTSHGNAIKPGSYVDLYFANEIDMETIPEEMFEKQGLKLGGTTYLDDQLEFFGRIATKVKVIDVKDSRGENVFTSDKYTDNEEAQKEAAKKKSSRLYTIAVDLEQLQWLNKAKLTGEVLPVAHGESYVDITNAEDSDYEEVIPDAMSDENITKKVIQSLTFNPQLIVNE